MRNLDELLRLLTSAGMEPDLAWEIGFHHFYSRRIAVVDRRASQRWLSGERRTPPSSRLTRTDGGDR